MLQDFFASLLSHLPNYNHNMVYYLSLAITILVITFISGIISLVFKIIIEKIINKILLNNKSVFLQVVVKNNSLKMVSNLAMLIVFWMGLKFFAEQNDVESIFIIHALDQVILFLIFLVCIFIITKLVYATNSYYERKFALAKQYPIQVYINIVVLFVWAVAAILIISFYLKKSPWALLTSFGAVSAVLLLVFKNLITGITSSVQITTSKILKVGDWISIDKYDVYGVVTNISFNTVRLKNADNTYSIIPTYILTSEIVKNWNGVQDNGAKILKKLFNVNPDTVIKATNELETKLLVYSELKDYLNKGLSNLSLYRLFIQNYLDTHLRLDHNNICVIRHLEPTLSGIPLQIYAFIIDIEFHTHERIQSEILEYCYMMLSEFDLKAQV